MTDIEAPANSVPGPRRSSPDRRRRKGPVATAVVLLAAFGAVLWFVSQDNDHAPSSPVRTNSPEPPRTVNTGESARTAADFEVIYKDLDASRVRAYQEYRPELLAEVYGPDCPAACGVDDARKAIQEMAAAGARFSQQETRVLGVQVVGEFNGALLENAPRRMVTIRVIDERAPFHVIRRDGTQGASNPGWLPKRRVFDLYFSPARGHWLISNHIVEGSVADFPSPSSGTGN
jgi:hypothetical protein